MQDLISGDEKDAFEWKVKKSKYSERCNVHWKWAIQCVKSSPYMIQAWGRRVSVESDCSVKYEWNRGRPERWTKI